MARSADCLAKSQRWAAGGTTDEVRYATAFEVTPVTANVDGHVLQGDAGPNLYYNRLRQCENLLCGPSTTAVNSTSIPTTITGSNGSDVVNYGNGDIDLNIPTAGTLHVEWRRRIGSNQLQRPTDNRGCDGYFFDVVSAGSRFRKLAGAITATVTSVNTAAARAERERGKQPNLRQHPGRSGPHNANGGNDNIQIDDATSTAPATVSSGAGDDQLRSTMTTTAKPHARSSSMDDSWPCCG
jgi:hypothetical protein